MMESDQPLPNIFEPVDTEQSLELARLALALHNKMALLAELQTPHAAGFPVDTEDLEGLKWLYDASVIISTYAETIMIEGTMHNVSKSTLVVQGLNEADQVATQSYVLSFDEAGNWLPEYSMTEHDTLESSEDEDVKLPLVAKDWHAVVDHLINDEEHGLSTEMIVKIFNHTDTSITNHELNVIEDILHQIEVS